MKKVLRLFFLLALFAFFVSACKYDRGIILFNTQPITRENALSDAKVFTVGQRVYYLFLAPNRMDNEYIRVQVFKMVENAPWGGNELIRRKDFRLMKDERYYHSDYFVFHSAGRYVMQVFSMDDLQHPLSIGDFYVRN